MKSSQKRKKTPIGNIVIAGAGAAGLSLYSNIRASEGELCNVLLIDYDIKQKYDRTWCYWAEKPFSLYNEVSHQWGALSFFQGEKSYNKALKDLTYYCVRSDGFYKKVLADIEQDPRAEFIQDRVVQIQSDEESAWVITESGETYHADWVFDSLPQKGLAEQFPEEGTWQHFYGEELEVDQPVFNPGEFVMMDFAEFEADDIRFAYILPFSPTRALVEITSFSESSDCIDTFRPLIGEYLKERWGVEVKEVLNEERGSIPMTAYRFERRPSPRVMRTGTIGGATRASTGYTFANIQRDSEAIVRSLGRKGHPFHGEAQSVRARFYDRLLLDLMHHEPERVPGLFYNMFKKNRPETVLRFLDGQTNLIQELGILLTLPWPPFLKALGRQIVKALKARFLQKQSYREGYPSVT